MKKVKCLFVGMKKKWAKCGWMFSISRSVNVHLQNLTIKLTLTFHKFNKISGMKNLQSFIANFFATQKIGKAKDLVVLLLLSGDI